MRYPILLIPVLLLASTASADSSWFEVHQVSGAVSTDAASTSASPGSAQNGRVYQTTIDATGVSAPINILGCASYTIVGDVVSGTFTPLQCTAADATRCSPCNSGTTCAVDEGCHEDSSTVGVLKITAATANDVIVLYCGKR